MPVFILFFINILCLLLLQRHFTRSFFKLIFLITNSQALSTRIFALIMLPGTILHELSHWLVAEILQVPTGKFDYMPKVEGTNIRMGSIQIARVDPFRRTIIGCSPVIVGMIIIIVLINMMPLGRIQDSPLQYILTIQSSNPQTVVEMINDLPSYLLPVNCLILYLIFIISNTMFSSRKDLEAAAVPLVVSGILGLICWKTGLLSWQNILALLNPLFAKFNSVLLIIIIPDLLIIILVKSLTIMSEKVLHRKVIERK